MEQRLPGVHVLEVRLYSTYLILLLLNQCLIHHRLMAPGLYAILCVVIILNIVLSLLPPGKMLWISLTILYLMATMWWQEKYMIRVIRTGHQQHGLLIQLSIAIINHCIIVW